MRCEKEKVLLCQLEIGHDDDEIHVKGGFISFLDISLGKKRFFLFWGGCVHKKLHRERKLEWHTRLDLLLNVSLCYVGQVCFVLSKIGLVRFGTWIWWWYLWYDMKNEMRCDHVDQLLSDDPTTLDITPWQWWSNYDAIILYLSLHVCVSEAETNAYGMITMRTTEASLEEGNNNWPSISVGPDGWYVCRTVTNLSPCPNLNRTFWYGTYLSRLDQFGYWYETDDTVGGFYCYR